MTFKMHHDNDEEDNLKQVLLSCDVENSENSDTKPTFGQLEEEWVDDYAHWSPWKKRIVLFILFSAISFKTWQLIRPWVEPNQVLKLQQGPLRLAPEASSPPNHYASMDFQMIQTQDVRNQTLAIINGPIPPPFHPHHSASVTYSSSTSPNGVEVFRRDIKAPCEFGVLTFSVGPAKEELLYTYELYNDAYRYSDNNGLCFFYPTWTAYTTSLVPLSDLFHDPHFVIMKPLDKNVMHRISSRILEPYHTDNEWDRDKVGDYAIVAKHNFYNHDFYQALKAEINSWK